MKRICFLILISIACTFNVSAGRMPPGKSNDVPIDEVLFSKDELKKVIEERRPAQFLLGRSKQQRNVEAWFFPGTSDNNALVIGGVHGSELSSIEVAKALIRQLSQGKENYYNVIIIPSLFPDNAMKAMEEPVYIGSTTNTGRYSMPSAVDPNRQMPSPGRAFNEQLPLDHLGRKIEVENQLLLQLIQWFGPQRIINVHAIRNTGYGGVYADPRTDENGIALGYSSDKGLALAIATFIHERGGNVDGNNMEKEPTTLYYRDPEPVPAGSVQKRNMTGSILNANRGSGVSLGTWASTAIANEKDPSRNRDAMRIITMEYPGYKRPVDYTMKAEQSFQQKQVELFAAAIREIFLGRYFVEDISLRSQLEN